MRRNRPINQNSTTQSTFNQSIDQSMDWCINKPLNQSIDWSLTENLSNALHCRLIEGISFRSSIWMNIQSLNSNRITHLHEWACETPNFPTAPLQNCILPLDKHKAYVLRQNVFEWVLCTDNRSPKKRLTDMGPWMHRQLAGSRKLEITTYKQTLVLNLFKQLRCNKWDATKLTGRSASMEIYSWFAHRSEVLRVQITGRRWKKRKIKCGKIELTKKNHNNEFLHSIKRLVGLLDCLFDWCGHLVHQTTFPP